MSNVIRNFKGTVTIYNNFIVEQYFTISIILLTNILWISCFKPTTYDGKKLLIFNKSYAYQTL